MEANTDQIDERDGEAAPQPDVIQAQPMDLTLDQKAITADTKQRAGTQLTTNNVESGIGDLRSVAGHQAERADVLLRIEAMKFHMNTIADFSHQYGHCDGQLGDRIKHVAENFSVIRRGKSEDIHGTQMRMAAIPSEVENLVCWNGFGNAQALKVLPRSTAKAASQRHTVHGNHKITAILDATLTCFHTDMNELIHEPSTKRN